MLTCRHCGLEIAKNQPRNPLFASEYYHPVASGGYVYCWLADETHVAEPINGEDGEDNE